MTITATFLRDVENGGPADQPARVVSTLVDFILAARSSLHLAIYDFRLDPAQPAHDQIVNALRDRANAGVDVKIAFDHGKSRSNGYGIDPAPTGTAAFLAGAFSSTRVLTRSTTDLNPQHPDPRLMHDKYIIRDGGSSDATVWTGALNITDDSWTYQESNIVQVPSADLARYYETDFTELWETGNIDSTGLNDMGTCTVEGAEVQVAFSPGEGGYIDTQVANLIAGARRRVKLASMLLASRTVLLALQKALRENQVREYGGIYDATQMEQTVQNWQDVFRNQDLIPLFQEVAGPLARKRSDPFTPTSKHNFMHNKVVVVDDAVFTGSYNLSHSATQNAENALILRDAALAEQYCAYIDQLVTQYR